ncbi:unnamed protein product [Kuraishia capsulata CBS 1993]|uniref:Thymidylate kinase n=1 Tax=Kuraishia capsulata CBS 1993 TaxID=1382522 RepID=W6MKI4_9ASCO|nr:uncharacterized protein KUCA_T00001189001 [Kuraishia capsulata CBS 1993]CDK25222.1 unnamed protein product [Kuraishia capsulata CBS 1993]
MTRGPIILFEGLDRTGKSTQTESLVDALRRVGIGAELFRFPNRETGLGKMINAYLTGGSLNDETAHLLFSANRWECKDALVASSEAGNAVVIDRYIFSGVAYSAAKGLEREWCVSPDLGLPSPDIVIFFKFKDTAKATERGQYGEERYEKVEFQKLVRHEFEKFEEESSGSWNVVYVDDKPIAEVAEEVWQIVGSVCEKGIEDEIRPFQWEFKK